MALGFFVIALEFPLPQLKYLAIHRSIVFRIILLLFQTFLGILYYQVNFRSAIVQLQGIYIVSTGYECCYLVIYSCNVLHARTNTSRDDGRSKGE